MPFYVLSPLLSRLSKNWVLSLREFSVRMNQCDIYTFANLIADYQPDYWIDSLLEVEQVIDAGANVGAFSFLITHELKKVKQKLNVFALEPDTENVAFLKKQPFASDIIIQPAALGARSGWGEWIAGFNSVTHQLGGWEPVQTDRASVPIVSLDSFPVRRTFLKMDIEGGEVDVLRSEIPDHIRFILLEWHSPIEEGGPQKLLPQGSWKCLSRESSGASTWFWKAK